MMSKRSINQPFLSEIILRSAAWILISCFERAATAVLKFSLPFANYYVVAIGVSIFLVAVIRRLGDEDVIKDLQEICLYDVFVQIYGLYLYETNQSTRPYVVLAVAILLWKYVRILWFSLKQPENPFPRWPVFGLIGAFSKGQQTHALPVAAKIPMAAATILTIPAAYFYTLPEQSIETFLLYGIPFLLVLLFTKRILRFLAANDDARVTAQIALINAEQAVEIANRQAEFATARLKDQQIIEAQNAELASKNTELAASNRRLGQLNATLKNRNVELQALYEERDEMAQTLAARNDRLGDDIHDQKNNTIAMSFRAKELRNSAVDESQRETATLLFDEVEDLSRHLVGILHAAKMENHFPKPPGKQVIAAKSFCHYLFERLNPVAVQHEVTLRCRYPKSDEVLAIEIDEDIFKRIVINLLLNAIQYAGPNREACITFYGGPDGCYVHVYDTGPGMEGLDGPDRVENFEILTERVAKAYVERENQNIDPLHPTNGNGIGLLNVQRLCRDLRVSIKLRSKLGLGTDFCLKLPLAVPELPTED